MNGTNEIEGLRNLARAGSAVADLMEHPGWEVLIGEIRGRHDLIIATMIHGNPFTEAAKYADKAGEARGLEGFTEIAEQIISNGESAAEQIEYMEATA
jgi:hypothetical protein